MESLPPTQHGDHFSCPIHDITMGSRTRPLQICGGSPVRPFSSICVCDVKSECVKCEAEKILKFMPSNYPVANPEKTEFLILGKGRNMTHKEIIKIGDAQIVNDSIDFPLLT